MKHIFEPVQLGHLTAKNRIVRSATQEKGAKDGQLTPEQVHIYTELADGGVGLIITGMMGIGTNACLSPKMVDLAATTPETLKAMADTIHQHGSKVVIQLSNCGAQARLLKEGTQAYAPSDRDLENGQFAKAMTEDEIRAVTQDFVNAALLCKEAGVDGVQLHAAHGYLLSQFLSPCYNTRTDAYGGSIENRARLLFEVYDAVRAAVGDDYPIFIKINASDLEDGGLTEAESTWVCQQLDARGIDAVELSSGVGLSRNSRPSPKIPDEEAEGCFAAPAQALAEVIGAPVISVGGYRTPAIIERFLNEGNIAAIALCRPLIREPALAARWQAGDTRKADCISCSKCFIPRVHSCPQVTPME